MITRRTFMSALAATAVASDVSWPQVGSNRVALYASVGPTLTHYDVDVTTAELSRRSSVTLPANVQYAWPHVSRQYLYVASSHSSPGRGGVVGDTHHVSAFKIDPAGTVHVHPNGRVVYGVNRADTVREVNGQQVFVGGENNIATYTINQETGEPTLIAHTETQGIHCRTFHIDPSGQLLVAAHIRPLKGRESATVRTVPACLSVFRIANDGRLDFVRKYDVDVGNHTMFWMGMVPR